MFFPSLAHPRPSIAAFQFLYYLTLGLFGKMLFAADGIQFKGQVLDSPALGFLAVRVLGIRRLFAIHLYFGVRPHNYRLDERMFLVPVEIGVEEFLQGRGIAPRLLNRVGIVSDLLVNIPGEIAAVDIFADFTFPIDKENLGSLANLLVFCLSRRPKEHFCRSACLGPKVRPWSAGNRAKSCYAREEL